MFWSSEGYYFMRCSEAEATALSQAMALHRAWHGVMARGIALITVEEPGVDALEAQLDMLRSKTNGADQLCLGPDGLEALHTVISEAIETLQSYGRASDSARSGQGLYGMMEDCFGEDLRDPAVCKKVRGQLEALSQRIGLEAN